jgi:uroporphyrinogen-III synthase
MDRPCDLAGLGVLVTRPAGQGERLCGLIRSANGRPLAFPAIEILPTPEPNTARDLLSRAWDLVIFISTNAVSQALALGIDGRWPAARRLAAVGRATAQALAAGGRAPDLMPASRYDSESLLAMPELSRLAGQRALIVRGQGGRALLGDELSRRGASVRYAEVYRRAIPTTPVDPLLERWNEDVQVVTATSDEVLHNLRSLLGERGRPLLLDTPLVVISRRTAETAEGLGFRCVRVADRAQDEALVRAICGLAGARS